METTTNTTMQTLGDELRVILSDYLESRPWQSATGLSNDQVGKTTLHKIINGESKSPTPRTVAGILKEINKGKSWNTIVESYSQYPLIHSTISSYVQKHHQATSQNINASNELESCFRDKDLFRAIIMTQDDFGVSRETLEKLFGYEVTQSINSLIIKGVLSEKQGRIYSTNEIINADQETVLAFAKNLLDKSYNIEAFGTGINNELRIEYRTNVNKEYVMPLLSKEIIKLQKNVAKILDNEEAQGNDTVWTLAAMDSLLKFSIDEQNNKENLQ